MTNLELAQRALDVYADRDHWTYVQGGLGEMSDSKRIKGLYDYYRRVGKNSMTCDYDEWLPQYGKAKDGQYKHCTDCSNFIQYLLGSGKNASAWCYNNMPTCPDMFTAPVGAILLIPGKHVGIVTKQGIRNADGTWKVEPEGMDFYAYNKPPRNGSYINAVYTKAVYLTGIDYINSEAVPIKISATVNGTHYLNDTLSAKDFTIKVTMSDGSVLTNPSNWSAWPLKLTDNVTDIVVKYQTVSTVLKVKYPAEIK